MILRLSGQFLDERQVSGFTSWQPRKWHLHYYCLAPHKYVFDCCCQAMPFELVLGCGFHGNVIIKETTAAKVFSRRWQCEFEWWVFPTGQNLSSSHWKTSTKINWERKISLSLPPRWVEKENIYQDRAPYMMNCGCWEHFVMQLSELMTLNFTSTRFSSVNAAPTSGKSSNTEDLESWMECEFYGSWHLMRSKFICF